MAKKAQKPEAETNEIAIESAETIGRDLLQALVQELKLLPDVWVKISQGQLAAENECSIHDCPVMKGPLCIEWIKGWKAWQEANQTKWWREHGTADEGSAA